MKNNATAPRNVTVIGLGLMGSALAEALLNASHQVTVWNRTPAKAEPMCAKGAYVASSVSDAILASDVILVCVTGYAATMDLLTDLVNPAEEKTLVQLSTMSPNESRDLARWAESKGIGYLDGSILGLPSSVIKGEAMLIYSGPKDLYDANEALFAALSAPRHLSSEIGASVTFDRVWYAYAYGVVMSFLQGAAMAHALGFSFDAYVDTVKARSPVVIDQCLLRGEKIRARSYETSDARIEVWADGFANTLSLCRDKGVDDALPSVVMDHLRRASASGYKDSDMAAVFEVLIGTEQGECAMA